MASEDDIFSRLSPRTRTLAGLVLALSNLMVVLDLTIANVSVPHIAGNLGISPDQGTWIITSYAVAEAICVPLTVTPRTRPPPPLARPVTVPLRT